MRTFRKAGDVLSVLLVNSLRLRFFFFKWFWLGHAGSLAMLERLGYRAEGRAPKLNSHCAQPTRAQCTRLVWKWREGWGTTKPQALSHALESQMALKHTLRFNICNAYILHCHLSYIM